MLLTGLTLGGCTIVQLREETRDFYAATVLAGHVIAQGWQGPVTVAASTRRDGKTFVAHQVWLHEPGAYELIVADGTYTLVAFGDRDNDGQPDALAPIGAFDKPVSVARAGLITLLDIPLGDAGTPSLASASYVPVRRAPLPSTQIGARAHLDHAMFSGEAGQRGYWAPLESFRVHGGNVHFVEDYDPRRTPVLFIHGAAGSARDFRFLIDRLDRRRYQAWIFQYPSGAPLDSMSHLLYWKILNLQLRFGFTRLHLVAHSMGGLVAQGLLADHGAQFPQLGQFISISTPWNGEVNATLGVNHSPAVIPSWRDMQPDGRFLQTLFGRPLPPGVGHSLLFGHRGGYSLLRPTSDGTITLASQLRSEAQAQAGLVMGFDEDHVSILSAPEVASQVQRVLDADGGRNPGAGGSLRLQLLLPQGHSTAGGIPTVVLTRISETLPGEMPARLLLTVPAQPRDLGPIEAAEYDVQVAAGAFRSVPQRHRVIIKDRERSEVAFELVPQGVLSGQIVGEEDPVAQPAGSLQRSDDAIAVDSIVLEGPAERRELQPRRVPDSLRYARLDGRDEAVNQFFSFTGLPAGEHVLTIRARGYAEHVSIHQIEPGKLGPQVPVVMRKETR